MRLAAIRSNRKTTALVLSGVAALVIVGGALGYAVLGGNVKDLAASMPTTGQWAPLTWQKPLLPSDFIPNPLAPPRIDPDSMVRTGADVQTVLTRLGNNRYRLQVSNVSGIGFINSFHWFPPGGMTLEKVTGSSSGTCELTGTSGAGGNLFQVTLNPEIKCSGISLKPPTCTCRGDGGHLDITFTVSKGSGGGLEAGSARIETGTPVLKIIPSYVPRSDLPLCAKGQKPGGSLNSNAKACAAS